MQREDEVDAALPAFGTRRDVLIDATIKVVARSGIRALTYRSVAREARVAHGLVAHHFGSIDALLDAAMERSIEKSVGSLHLVPESGRLQDFAKDIVTTFVELDEDMTFQAHLLVEGGANPRFGRHLDYIHARYRAAIREALESFGLEATPGLVEFIYATLDGIALHQVVGVAPETNELAMEWLRALLETVVSQSSLRRLTTDRLGMSSS